MRANTDKAKIRAFMIALGNRVSGDGTVYLAGGVTAVLHDWRPTTVDVDIKPDPEPAGLFEALACLKDDMDINVAIPDHLIPAIPGWPERSLFIAQEGRIKFLHYDPYGQALSKLQRRHERDIRDVQSMHGEKMIRLDRLQEMFDQLESQLIRYPALDAMSFRAAVRILR